MIEKNQEFTVFIEGYGSEGQGVARVNGFVVFVKNALIGEIVKIHIIKVTKSYAVGKLIEVVKGSKERAIPPCRVYGKCGGCALQHATYDNSLEIKRIIIEDAFKKIAKINIDIPKIIASDKVYGYRNKGAFPLVVSDGKLCVAMFKTMSHTPVFVDNCLISSDKINKCAKIFTSFVNNYDKDILKTGYKYLVVREIENKVLCCIVSESIIPNSNSLFDILKKELGLSSEELGLVWCKKAKDNNVTLEGKVTKIEGINKITTNILGIDVDISIMSFFQVNLKVMEKIYNEVLKNIEASDIVIDAYSGAGLLSALISKTAKHVFGIEIVKDATNDANELKSRNNIKNLTNINADVAVELIKLADNYKNNFALVLDPPRKGVDKKVIETTLNCRPKKIIYVSCSPASLARDVGLLCENGEYELESVKGFDMFPWTHHVETVAVLKRKRDKV